MSNTLKRRNVKPTLEEQVRGVINQNLTAAGWAVQDFQQLNLGASPGVSEGEGGDWG